MFDIAYNKTMGHEGGYSNNSHDRGGETYRGISRKYHPNWTGWIFVDNGHFHIPALAHEVKKFYYNEYWLKTNLDIISKYIPTVSVELFDISVHFGQKKSSKTLQRALNLFNRDEQNYKDLTIDGIFGSKTLAAIRAFLQKNPDDLLLKMIVLLKAKYYIDIIERNPTQEIFIRGWLNRINL